MYSARYPTITGKGKFFFTEEFQLINAEVMMELKYHHFTTLDELMIQAMITNGC